MSPQGGGAPAGGAVPDPAVVPVGKELIVGRVARWLDAVPHVKGKCIVVLPGWGFFCACDRARRQAEAVVRLAQQCCAIGRYRPPCPDPIALALEILEGVIVPALCQREGCSLVAVVYTPAGVTLCAPCARQAMSDELPFALKVPTSSGDGAGTT